MTTLTPNQVTAARVAAAFAAVALFTFGHDALAGGCDGDSADDRGHRA